MKKMISICLLLFFIFIGLTAVFFQMLHRQDELVVPYEMAQNTEIVPETETQEPLQAIMSIQKNYAYLIRVDEGRLVVYESDGETIYLETNIRYADLDDEMQKKAEEGIPFENARELYEFLENYSS